MGRGLERPDYQPEQVLAAGDLRAEQLYLVQRLRRHNHYLHGWGIVCGLKVAPAADPLRPWSLWVCPGYAIDPCGSEIIVDCRGRIDVADYLWARPSRVSTTGHVVFVGIRYAECLVDAVAPERRPCDCGAGTDLASRIRESFEIAILWSPLAQSKPSSFDLCRGGVAPCPEWPGSPYVLLASVTLPAGERNMITTEAIDLAPGRH